VVVYSLLRELVAGCERRPRSAAPAGVPAAGRREPTAAELCSALVARKHRTAENQPGYGLAAPAQAPADVCQGQALQVVQLDGAALVVGQLEDRFGQSCESLLVDRRTAGGRCLARQPDLQPHRRRFEGLLQRLFSHPLLAPRPQSADLVGEDVGQRAAQPSRLLGGAGQKAVAGLIGHEECLLHDPG
jgi:hypothetical protein